MKFSIHTAVFLERDELISRLKETDVSAILLDDDLKVIFKKLNNTLPGFGLRDGMKLERFMSESDYKTVAEMKFSEVFHTELSKSGVSVSAAVICSLGGRLFLINNLFADMKNIIDGTCTEMSGYDVDLDEVREKAFGYFKRSRYCDISKLFQESLDLHKIPRELSVFNSSAVLKNLVAEINSRSDNMERNININMGSEADELFAEGSEKNFLLAVAYLIAFCLGEKGENSVLIDVADMNGEAMFRISASTGYSPYELADLLSFRTKKEVFDGGETAYLLYTVRLIFWDFSVEHGVDGFVAFTLRLKKVKTNEGFMLCDISSEYLRKIISLFFG